MNKQILYLFLFSLFISGGHCFAQVSEDIGKTEIVTPLFRNQDILQSKLNYSNRHLKRNTNDSTYITTDFSYKTREGSWKAVVVNIRARANWRRANCTFSPVKIKLKKSNRKGTMFEGNKNLKLVIPCLIERSKNDNVIKEYMAYKLYELVSPYHFKTRLLDIDFTDDRGKKNQNFAFKGFLIEDDKLVAKRLNSKVLDRDVHPLQQEAMTALRNSFFQFMIGNTDFSITYRHNEKLLFIDKKIVPVPYDFDMSGLVDASYAVVSEIQNETLKITHVTQRLFRGFKRDEELFYAVRKEFIANKSKSLETIESLETFFENPKDYNKTKEFILEFYEIIEDDKKFKKSILDKARTR